MGIQDEHQQAQKRTQEGGEDWRLASQATISGPAGLLSATLCIAEVTRLMVYDAEAAFCYATLLSAPSNVRVLQTRQQRRVIGANVTILDMSSAGGPLRAALTPCTNSARVFIVPGVRAGGIPSPNAPVLLKTRDGELARGMVLPSPLPLRKSKMDPGVPGCITWRSCRGLASQAIFPAEAIDESVHCSSTLNNGHPICANETAGTGQIGAACVFALPGVLPSNRTGHTNRSSNQRQFQSVEGHTLRSDRISAEGVRMPPLLYLRWARAEMD